MFKIQCKTKLDLPDEIWPNYLPAIPRIGEMIESQTKWNFFQLRLKITEITWRKSEDLLYYPEIQLYFHHHETKKEFYEFYYQIVDIHEEILRNNK